VSETLRRIAEAVADITEDEVAAALGSLGALKGRERHAVCEVPRAPLPLPGSSLRIQSEVEWV
jgi:phytoene/squalene synthetase